ncbi:MAG: polynucleotide adenylyltransferase PcnB [Burkholderiales bacterium]|nr:polynucleotide adenylyltransferase PcnB [Burkholderiales bacterium]
MIRGIIARLLKTPNTKPQVYSASEHPVRAEQIDAAALSVVRRLQDAGFQAFVVGGAVRDLLLARRPKDFDVATNATPEEIRPLFRRAFIIGRRFRLVHVHIGHEVIEVSTFRGAQTDENATDDFGRLLSDNVYGSQADDAVRRDFTINALYFDPTTESVWDYVGGIKDVRMRRLKLIGTPATRYREDPVRMLRAIRLAIKLDLTIAPSSEKPIKKLASLMENIPTARLFEETQKLLLSGNAQKTIDEVRRYRLMPALDAIIANEHAERFIRLALTHTDNRLMSGRSVSPVYLFAALLWPAVVENRDKRIQGGEKSQAAFLNAIEEILESHGKMLSVPRRFQGSIREIWMLQPRFTQRVAQRPYKLLEQPRFRIAYDFMRMRAENDELPEEVGLWWEKFQTASHDEQRSLIAEAGDPPAKKPRQRRRRSGNKTAKPAETSE